MTEYLIRLAFLVIADAPQVSVTGIGGIITGLSGTGFAVWYAYHTTTKTVPDLNSQHAATIREQNATHAATVKEVNAVHAAAIKDLTATNAAQIRELTSAFSTAIKEVQREAREETRVDRHLYRNESNVRHLEVQALTVAVEELVEKLGHPGALQIKSPKVVVSQAPDDSDPDMKTEEG